MQFLVLLINLLLILAHILHGEEKEPVGCMLEQRCGEPVDETRSVGFLAFEQFLQRPFYQFLRRNGNGQSHG